MKEAVGSTIKRQLPTAKAKRKMSASEGEFIFDAVIGYLTSPIWNFPVRTFIEHNSLGMLQFPHSFWEFYSWVFVDIVDCKFGEMQSFCIL